MARVRSTTCLYDFSNMSFRGRGGGGGRGFGGGRNSFGGRGGGRGGFNRNFDQGPPERVIPLGYFAYTAQDDLICKVELEDVPFFNAPIYLENKEQIGKIDEIFGNLRDYSVSIRLGENMKASSFKVNQKVSISSILYYIRVYTLQATLLFTYTHLYILLSCLSIRPNCYLCRDFYRSLQVLFRRSVELVVDVAVVEVDLAVAEVDLAAVEVMAEEASAAVAEEDSEVVAEEVSVTIEEAAEIVLGAAEEVVEVAEVVGDSSQLLWRNVHFVIIV